jgi:NAD+ synthase
MSDHLTRTIESYFPGKPKHVGKLDFSYKKKIDLKTIENISKFIRENTVEPDYWNGVVVGISDGLDGATATALSLKALGKNKVIGVIVNLGGKDTHDIQEELAIKTARALDVNYVIIDALKVYRELQALVTDRGPFTDVNIGIRVVEDLIFQIADEKNYAVISTINKSEILTGRITENFYGHLAPLAGLYKTEIFDLARILGIPQEIINRKPGGVDTWYDEDTFGVTYDTLDKMLYLLTEEEMNTSEISRKYDFDQEWIDKLKARTRQRFWRLTTKELHF